MDSPVKPENDEFVPTARKKVKPFSAFYQSESF